MILVDRQQQQSIITIYHPSLCAKSLQVSYKVRQKRAAGTRMIWIYKNHFRRKKSVKLVQDIIYYMQMISH